MPPRKRSVDPGVQEALFGLQRVLGDGDVPDWSAVQQADWGEIVALLGPLDAGVMIRSSERGASRSIGVFVGGQSQWTTCRDQRELLALLQACQETLSGLLGRRQAPDPVVPQKPARRASKGT